MAVPTSPQARGARLSLTALAVLCLLLARGFAQPFRVYAAQGDELVFDNGFVQISFNGQRVVLKVPYAYVYNRVYDDFYPFIPLYYFFLNSSDYVIREDRVELIVLWTDLVNKIAVEEHAILPQGSKYVVQTFIFRNVGETHRPLTVYMHFDSAYDDATIFKVPDAKDYWFNLRGGKERINVSAAKYILLRDGRNPSGYAALLWETPPAEIELYMHDHVYLTYRFNLPPGGSQTLKFYIVAAPSSSEAQSIAELLYRDRPAVNPLPAEEVLASIKLSRELADAEKTIKALNETVSALSAERDLLNLQLLSCNASLTACRTSLGECSQEMYKLKFENSKLASELSAATAQRNVLATLTAALAAVVLALLLKRGTS
jgi:hypothetical protein